MYRLCSHRLALRHAEVGIGRSMISLGTSIGYVLTSTTTNFRSLMSDNSIKILPAPGVNVCVHPMMIVGGPASDIKRDESMFRISANQYVQMFCGIGNVRVLVTISDSPRYQNSKPFPYSNGSNTSVSGLLMGVTHVKDINPLASSSEGNQVDTCHIKLMNVAYFPRSHAYVPTSACEYKI